VRTIPLTTDELEAQARRLQSLAAAHTRTAALSGDRDRKKVLRDLADAAETRAARINMGLVADPESD
jgi:hypothetical protein